MPSSQQTVILNGITTSSCGLDIACVCRDDEFLTSLQSELATSCNRHDQASKLISQWASHCALGLLYSCIFSLERMCHQTLCSYAFANRRAPSAMNCGSLKICNSNLLCGERPLPHRNTEPRRKSRRRTGRYCYRLDDHCNHCSHTAVVCSKDLRSKVRYRRLHDRHGTGMF